MKTLTIRSKILYCLILISLLNIGANAPLPRALQTDTIVFAVIGDYGSAGQAEADVANLVKSWNPNFIVTVGDNNYPDGAAYSIDQNIGQYYHEYIYNYSGKYGNGSATRRFLPAMGNHDWHAYSPDPYINYFDLPGEETYYKFTYGPVQFFILDSVEYEPDGNTVTSMQAKWLKNALAASTASYNVVVTHYSPYSSGKHGVVPFMQWPFKEWGADVVLAGHDHDYERLQVNGLTYFVNGLGGDELGNFRSSILPESQIHYNQDFGAMRVEATSTYMKFQFYTRGNVLIDEYILSNSIPTATALVSASPKLTNAHNLDFNLTFSEPVSGVDASDFRVTVNGAPAGSAYVSNVSGADANYVISVNTGTNDGALRLDLVDDDSIVNSYGAKLGNYGAGNGNRSSEIYTIDKTAPAVLSVTRAGASPTNAATVDFAVTFSEPVSGVDVSDFSLISTNGAYINTVSGNGAAYLVSVNTGSADDVLRLDVVGNGSVMDAAGNPLNTSFTSGEAYTIDKTAPVTASILRANPNPTSAILVDFNIAFSEPVTGVDASDFVLSATNINGAYITNVSGADTSYTVSVNTGSGSGDLRLDLVSDLTIVDGIGNALTTPFNTGESYTVDKSAPIVLAISRAGSSLSNAGSVDFNVTFSEPVTGVDAADFTLTTDNITGAYISSVNGSAANYVVTVNTGAGDGTLKMDLIDDDSIVNITGSKLGTSGMGNGNFISTEPYTLDKTAPVIVSILRANPDPSNAASVDYIVNFSEPVSGVDISDFVLNTTNGALISNINGSGASYIVSITTGVGADALRLDAMDNDSIVDVANNPTNGNFTSGETYTINKTPPVVLSIQRASPNPSNATSVDYIVNFSEPVSGVDVSDFVLTASGVSGAAINSISGSGTMYILSVKTGIGNGALRLDLVDNNSIVNLVNNVLGGANPGDGNFTGETYDIAKFTTEAKDFPAPKIINPQRKMLLNTSTPVFSWRKVEGAQYYEAVIARDSGFTQIVATQATAGTSFTSAPLSDGTYYWRVRGYTSNNQVGKFSGTESFTIDATPPPVPILLTPVNNATLSARFNFSWENSGATRYQLEIDNNADFSSPEWRSLRADPNYQIASMKRGTYYWRVRARDMANNWSEWSTVFRLSVP
jgi:hypothetical protein